MLVVHRVMQNIVLVEVLLKGKRYSVITTDLLEIKKGKVHQGI